MKKLSNKLIKNEIIDFLELNDILYMEDTHSIEMLHPNHGKCTYWIKKDKLHIHNKNTWIDNGYYFLKYNL